MTVATVAPPFVVVDDDADHALIVRTVLSMIAPAADVTVLTDARDFAAGLAGAPEGAVIVIDRLLGQTEAFPLIASTCGRRPDLHIALLSATLSERDQQRAREAGATVSAEKPGSIAGWQTLLGDLIRCYGETPTGSGERRGW